jgi:hypothetical protein
MGHPEGLESVEDGQRADAQAIAHLLEKGRPPVFYIMRNDDWVELNLSRDRGASLHGVRVELGG